MNLIEFFESDQKMAIHCASEDKALRLLQAFDALGKTWGSGRCYLGDHRWKDHREQTCYSNKGSYGDVACYFADSTPVIEYDDIEDIGACHEAEVDHGKLTPLFDALMGG